MGIPYIQMGIHENCVRPTQRRGGDLRKEEEDETMSSVSTQEARLAARMQREIKILHSEPPPGVCAWPSQDSLLTRLQAQIEGPEETAYAKGIFKLELQVPGRYPFEPPIVRFVTPIYHPNIDNGGRICLDILNLPPKGSWRPSLNIATVLSSIRLLLSEPNPDDGLMGDISAEYKYNRAGFERKARQWTHKHAAQVQDNVDLLPIDVLYPDSTLAKQEASTVSESVKPVSGAAEESSNETENKVKDKAKRKDQKTSPSKLIHPASNKLSLAKGSALQAPKLPPCKLVLQDEQNHLDNFNASFNLSNNADTSSKCHTDDSSSQEKGRCSVKLIENIQNGGLSHAVGEMFNAQRKNTQKAVLMEKENLQTCLAGKKSSKLSLCKTNGNPKVRVQENRSIQAEFVYLEAKTISSSSINNEAMNSTLQQVQPKSSSILQESKLSMSGADVLHDKCNEIQDEGASESPLIVVSDSESDEEAAPLRSRLSLSHKILNGKRKRSVIR